MATERIKTSYGPAATVVIPSSVRAVGAWWAIGRAHEQSSRFDLTIDLEKKAPDWSDAKSSSSTTIYGKACEFDAVTDLEEVQIRKSPDWPNRHLQIRLRLQINSVLKPPDSIWSCNRTLPKIIIFFSLVIGINLRNRYISTIIRLLKTTRIYLS